MALPPQVSASLKEVGMQEVDLNNPMRSLGRCWAIEQPWDTAPGIRKCTGKLEQVRGSPGLQGGRGHLVLRLSDTQTQLDATQELRMKRGPIG